MIRTIKLLTENIDTVAEVTKKTLSEGGLVVFPSDTVYGLLVDATNEVAVKKLIQFKNRAHGKAISIFVETISLCQNYVKIDQKQQNMLQNLLPGSFTIILPSKHTIQKMLESENGTLGVRIPDYQPVLRLAEKFKKPITATSANLGGRHPHYSIQSLLNRLSNTKKDLIDLVVDAGKLPRNKPSTVVDLSGNTVKILRKGDVLFEQIDKFQSHSPHQTQEFGRNLINEAIGQTKGKPIVIILKGDLGSGKTEMTRGIADYFDIDKIVSPTYVIYYEYEITTQKSKVKSQIYNNFIHVDLYNIQEEEEFEQLGLEDYLKPGNVMVVEWGEKLGSLFDTLKRRSEVIFVEIEYDGEKGRKIRVMK